MWQHLVDSTGGLETLKKSRNCTNIKQSDVKLETIPEPQEGQPSVRSAALLRRPPSLRLNGSISSNLRLVARTQRWVYFHPVSGFYSDPSLLFFFYYYYYLKEEAGCHWLSSRAQTCCGHPVRPFTFFSVPKDSCRPSVCDTKNTPNDQHHQKQQQQQEEATNKPQSVWTFSDDYYMSCCSAGQTKRAGKCGRLT